MPPRKKASQLSTAPVPPAQAAAPAAAQAPAQVTAESQKPQQPDHPLLHTMLKSPSSRTHMLFLGPPGSGKTTTAQRFAACLHGTTTNTFASLLFLNSSDERSLETIRHKVYPFVESRMQSLFFGNAKAPPKVIIFDEAETLTDQAQCALRPLLQRPTSEVILIFICNSLSHIHPQIFNKFLVIPFAPMPPARLKDLLSLPVPPIDAQLRRGDLRFFKQSPHHSRQITHFLHSFLHASTSAEVYALATAEGCPFRERISWFLIYTKSPDTTLWSALTASETQPYLEDATTERLLFELWRKEIRRLTCSSSSSSPP